jgi:aspartate ammonia-lyase
MEKPNALTRKESDFIGEAAIPADALYGIHAFRAKENFPDQTPFHHEWYEALGLVKQACYITAGSYFKAVKGKYPDQDIPVLADEVMDALIHSAAEMAQGLHFRHWIVPAVSGGAGTSINMNANEILANLALIKLGFQPGDYSRVDPFLHANVFQSTNDVVPTALKVCVLKLLDRLEQAVNATRSSAEKLEKENLNTLRTAYTQMQEAVPSSFGKLFGTYSEALSRDWWRVSKCAERLKLVNLGGGAAGTGLAIPRYFIMEVVTALQKLTNLPVARSENLADATANLDSLVEVHAILKAHAVNLEKMASDLRLLASDLNRPVPSVGIPARQTGSSIMPGKVNPVIPEFVISCAHQVQANDSLVSGLCAQGCLDLNAYLPLIGHTLISSIKLLVSANHAIARHLLEGMSVNATISLEQLMHSASVTTALIPFVGYHKASQIAALMKAGHLSVTEANRRLRILDDDKLAAALKPEQLLELGYTLRKSSADDTLTS